MRFLLLSPCQLWHADLGVLWLSIHSMTRPPEDLPEEVTGNHSEIRHGVAGIPIQDDCPKHHVSKLTGFSGDV